MFKSFLKLSVSLMLVTATSGCSKPDQPAPQSPAELAAAAIAAELDYLSSMGPEEHALLKAMIKESGGTCTQITRVQGSEMDSNVQVDCSQGTDMPSTARYTIDLATGISVSR